MMWHDKIKLINRQEVEMLLEASENTVYRLQRHDPGFPCAVRIGSRDKWWRHEIVAWIEARRKRSG